MTYTDLQNFKAYLRDFDGIALLDDDYTRALNSAEASVDKFVGFDVVTEFGDDASVPAPIVSAAYILARIEVDASDVPMEQQLRARAESLLRPYRRETGFAGGAVVAA